MKLFNVLKVLSGHCSRKSLSTFTFNSCNRIPQKVLAQRILTPLSCHYCDSTTKRGDDFDSLFNHDIDSKPKFRSARTQDNFEDDGYSFQHQSRNYGQQRSFGNRRSPPHRFSQYNDDDDGYSRFSENDEDRYDRSRYEDDRQFGGNLKDKDWGSKKLEPVEKNFYVENDTVSAVSEKFLSDYYAKHNITVSKGEMIKPVMDFHHAGYPSKVVTYMERQNWTEPSPIQSLGWPVALSGKNMVGIAQTGSGKTLGFLLPALIHIKNQRQSGRGEGPTVLVLAPTRELVQQINSVAVEFGRLLGINSLCLFGGGSKNVQINQLQSREPELVTATPGRLIDLLDMGILNLERTTFLVLDEADRMLDMGFEPQIRKIMSQVRPDRQILMWSATWPQEIQQLAYDFLGDFTQVTIGSGELSANPNITQKVIVCDKPDRLDILSKEIRMMVDQTSKILIFTQTKSMADFLCRKLRFWRYKAESIHGDKTQRMRENTLHSFRSGRIEILVATDVAARGLDVNDITHVINYDYPNDADTYVHRIGRTGRASKTGSALTLITEEDGAQAFDLIKILKKTDQEIPEELYDLKEFARREKLQKRKTKQRQSSYGNRNYGNRNYGNRNYSNRNYGNRNYYGNRDYDDRSYGNRNRRNDYGGDDEYWS